MKKIINVVGLFLIPFILVSTGVVIYFKITNTVSNIKIPTITSISFSDLIKFSRFSLEQAPTESLSGNIVSMSGDVEYESRMATEAAKIVTPPAAVQQGESFTTGPDGNVSITFGNVLSLDIGPDSSLGIVQTLPKNLVFSQGSGSVVYTKLDNFPVSIRSMHLLIENYGKISVSIDKIKPLLTIKVDTGSATVAYNDTQNISRVVNIPPGKILIFNDHTRRAVLK